jgi:hypothetical protein
MPARGDLVGDAYVRIHADTTFMRRAIKRRVDADIADLGKSFEREMARAGDQIEQNWRRNLARMVVSADFSPLVKQFGTVDKAVDSVEVSLLHLVQANAISMKSFREAQKILEEWKVPAKQAEAAKQAAKAVEEAAKQQRVYNAELRKAEPQQVRAMTSSLEALGDALRKDNVNRAYNVDLLKRHRVNVETLTKKLAKNENSMASFSKETEKFALRLDRTGSAVGRLFGKGSRNDAINFFGSVIGGFTKLVISGGGLVHLFSSLTSSVGNLFEKFNILRASGDGFASAFTKTFGQAALAGLGGFIVSIGVLAFLMESLVVISGLLASSLALLTGALTAAAAAVTFGLVGALLPLVPLLLTLGPAIQTFTAVWGKLSADVKQQTPEVRKLSKAWSEVSKAMDPIADKIVKSISTITPALVDFWKPLVVATGEAAARVVEDFGGIFTDPAMKGFLSEWQDTLPRLFESLGHTLTDLTAGFIAFFGPVLDYSEKFAEALGGIAEDFRDWATSAEGQNAIEEFMLLAWESAKTLWDIVTQLGEALGKVFMSGETTGQGFLQYLADLAERFNQWLSTTEGQETMRNFWRDVQDFAKQGKDLIAALFKLFDELDTAQSRKQVSLFINGLTTIVGWLSSIVEWIGTWAGAMTALGLAIGRAVSLGVTAFRIFFTVVTGVFQGILVAATIALGWMPGLGEKLRVAAGNFSRFRSSANAELAKIDRTLSVTIQTAEAMASMTALQRQMAKLQDKTVVVTVKGQVVGAGAGRAMVGGQVMQSGGILTGPTHILAGEAGREAVVPLDRPLSLIDPAVRALAAFAQGIPYLARGGIGGGRSINISQGAITVNSPAADPRHVAMSVIDQIAASAY